MEEYLKIALIPDYEPSDSQYRQLKADLIQDKDKIIPNDQKLTRWIQNILMIIMMIIIGLGFNFVRYTNPKIFK